MLNILGMIILIIILFIIILLLTGIRIKLEYNKVGSEVKGCLKILIFRKIKVYSKDFPSPDDEEDDEEEIEDDEEEALNIRELFRLARPCFEDFKNYLKSVIKIISITRIDNHLIFGMSSFADTGKYIGIIWAILAFINPLHKNIHLSAEPRFTGSVLDGHGVNEVDIYPLKILIPTIRLVLKKEVRTFIRGVLDAR